MDDELRKMGLPTQFGKPSRPILNRKESHKRHNSKGFQQKKRQESAEDSIQKLEEKVAVPVSIERNLLVQLGPEPPNPPYIPEFPVSQEFQITPDQKKPISAIVSDESGNKYYTGCSDCSVNYWNLAGMSSKGDKAEVRIELPLSTDISALDVVPNGNLLLVGNGTPELKLFDHKGLKKGETKRGDMYLYDAQMTTGHVGEITGAQFRPKDPTTFASCSLDGTLRIWEVGKLEKQKVLYKLGQKGGPRNPAHAMKWSFDGNGVYVCANDNFVSYFDLNGPKNQATLKIQAPLMMSSIGISANGFLMAACSRNNPEVFLWDIRSLEKPLWSDKTKTFAHNLCFSPDSSHLLVPQTVQPKSPYGGSVIIINTLNGEIDDEILLPSGVGTKCCTWSPKTNQIAVGCSDGITRILFDVNLSNSGAIIPLTKGISIKTETDDAVVGALIPKLVNPETQRVIRGFWFPYTSEEKREKREAAEPKAPIWGEGHHGMTAIHPRQALLQELNQVDEPDDTDIVESLRAREKDAKNQYFTHVKDRHPDAQP